ncbi:flagellar motor switch protein FliN [Leifsonia sp. fls2-241-R2A-40a]|uniref:flagellar motor switch protein FliN n=1 Tax=Leifsonia sp. fls2-241-R2A-40a TaxID=3040290 RepID=UPI00254C5079|nr:flagellar motor switch protein FliN [Leifsonia sp. fls2-241-R2A-40a]
MSMTLSNTAGISLGQAQAAAEALSRLLPTGAPLTPLLAQGSDVDGANRAVVATFVGAVSADFAVVLLEAPQLVDDGMDGSPVVALQDVLQPALEAASDTLGAGVLDDARTDDAAELFADPSTTVFALSGPAGVAGWFAIRGRASVAERAATGVLGGKLARISNVEMALTVEIGRTRMAVRDVLAMEPGAVIELDRSAGSPADVLLNGRLIAHGEIVVVDQDYAVRITKILDAAEDLD